MWARLFVSAVCVLSAAPHGNEEPRVDPGPTDFTLTSLRSDCRLETRWGGLRLWVMVPCGTSEPARIRGLNDLHNLVTIDSEEKALEFVRLFSAKGRWMLTGVADYAEVLPGDNPERSFFIVSRKSFATCCRPPSVHRIVDSGVAAFEVERAVVDPSYRVYLQKEVVRKDGAWRIAGRQELKVDGRTLGVLAVHDR